MENVSGKAPCMNCTKRKLNCHSTCENYLEFREKLTQYNQDVRKNKFLSRVASERNIKVR